MNISVSRANELFLESSPHLNKHFLSLGVILTCLSITGFLQRKSKEKVQALHQSCWKARSNDSPHSSLSKEKKNHILQKLTTVSLCFNTRSVVMADEKVDHCMHTSALGHTTVCIHTYSTAVQIHLAEVNTMCCYRCS